MNKSSIRTAIFVSGRGSNMKALLESKAKGKLSLVNFVLVFSDLESPGAFKYARELEIPTLHISPSSFSNKISYENSILDILNNLDVELIVLAGYMRIIGPTLLDAFPNRIINIHPSLLPLFPGLNPQRQAIECGSKVSGCTVHFVDSGMDTGPIIMQSIVHCLDDTEETLSKRILEQEHIIYTKALDLISHDYVKLKNKLISISQDKIIFKNERN